MKQTDSRQIKFTGKTFLLDFTSKKMNLHNDKELSDLLDLNAVRRNLSPCCTAEKVRINGNKKRVSIDFSR